MYRCGLKIIVTLVIICISTFSKAGQNVNSYQYSCKITGAASGEMIDEVERRRVARQYIGKEFLVDLKSGRISGTISNSLADETLVNSYGEDGSSYQIVSIFRPSAGVMPYVLSLEVSEQTKGEIKPFVLMRSTTVLFGKCSRRVTGKT